MAVEMTEEQIQAARAKAAEVRNISGGVVGQFTPKEITVKAEDLSTSGSTVGLKIPAGKFVYGAYVKNTADDLGGSGTLTIAVGEVELIEDATAANIKGAGVAALFAEPTFLADETEVTLTPSAAYTAGKLVVGVIYG